MSEFRRHLFSILSLIGLAVVPLGLANAQVSVTAADPSSTVQGTVSLNVTVTGNGFNSSASVKFLVTGTADPGGIVVKNVNVSSAKQLIATIDVADTAALSKFDIEVALSNGRKGKGTTLFLVQPKETGRTTTDPCITPNVVTEATFPSFMFGQAFEISRQAYINGVFLADATGKCTRLIGTWDWQASTIGNFTYDADSNIAMVVSGMGSNEVVARVSSISFDANGPAASTWSAPIILLETTDIPVPAEAAAAGLLNAGGNAAGPWVSPDGSQLLMKFGFSNADQTFDMTWLWVCDLSYDTQFVIEPIDPSSCKAIHRTSFNPYYGESFVWGVVPGTIYITSPASADSSQFSLYRLTLQPAPASALVEEVFNNGTALLTVRVTGVPTGPDVSNGELVAVQGAQASNRCSTVSVIDAYDCTGLDCRVVNEKGMRSVTWLPDGRLAGREQSMGKKTCLFVDRLVAYPAIDPNATPPTVLTPTTANPYSLCPFCMEGDGTW